MLDCMQRMEMTHLGGSGRQSRSLGLEISYESPAPGSDPLAHPLDLLRLCSSCVCACPMLRIHCSSLFCASSSSCATHHHRWTFSFQSHWLAIRWLERKSPRSWRIWTIPLLVRGLRNPWSVYAVYVDFYQLIPPSPSSQTKDPRNRMPR
jgi:hypothetical protein